MSFICGGGQAAWPERRHGLIRSTEERTGQHAPQPGQIKGDESFKSLRLRRLELPESCIEGAVSYVEGYHYIDDEAYVRNYIGYRGFSKSRLKLRQELLKKGISPELFEQIWEESAVSESDILRTQIKKRIRQKGPVTEENFQKNLAFFARKGFSIHDILEILKEYKE